MANLRRDYEVYLVYVESENCDSCGECVKKADITADVLAGFTSVEQLASCPKQIDWLPDDLKQVRPDLPEIIPGLFAISRELNLAGESGNPLSQRLALREAMDQLDGLEKKLK